LYFKDRRKSRPFIRRGEGRGWRDKGKSEYRGKLRSLHQREEADRQDQRVLGIAMAETKPGKLN
jgi:hypothetical protein